MVSIKVIFGILGHVVGGILRTRILLIISDIVVLPVPLFCPDALALFHPNRVGNVRAVFRKIVLVGLQDLKYLKEGRGFAARHLVFQCDVMIPYVAIFLGTFDGVVQMNEPSGNCGVRRNGSPILLQHTIETKTVTAVLEDVIREGVHRCAEVDGDFHHIAVREVAGRSENTDGTRGRNVLRVHRRHHVRQPISTTILHVEGPIPAR